MISKILCFLGFHDWSEWLTIGRIVDPAFKECKRCKKKVEYR